MTGIQYAINIILRQVYGFYVPWEDRIYIPDDATTETLIHEMNHALGDVKDTTIQNRGINEAITEKLALIIDGDLTTGSSGYKENVEIISKLIKTYNENGYYGENIVFYSYLSSNNSDMLKNSLNTITGDSLFYMKLANFMDIADGCGNITDVTSRLKAKMRLNELLEEFEKSIQSIK